MTLAKQWMENAFMVMSAIEQTQMDQISQAAEIMADSIEAKRWVHTFGCGHANRRNVSQDRWICGISSNN